jgi:hypothetical protein
MSKPSQPDLQMQSHSKSKQAVDANKLIQKFI